MWDGAEGRENSGDTEQKVIVGLSKKAEHVKARNRNKTHIKEELTTLDD